MQIKICGITQMANAVQIAALAPDMMGFIFYAHSPRVVVADTAKDIIKNIPRTLQTVGVFVDEAPHIILNIVRHTGLTALQLTGTTQIDCARALKSLGFNGTILGAFAGTAENLAMLSAAPDLPFDFLLFDTASAAHGGTGRAFDWGVLQDYRGNIPFFLSGGIGPENIADAQAVRHPMLRGLDLNSKLESSPGIKDIARAQSCIETVRHSAMNA